VTVGELGGVHAVRADGGLVRIRHAVPADLPALRELHLAASDRSFYLRFFGVNRAAAEEYVRRLGRPAGPAHHSLTAWIAGRLVGVASYERLTDDSAELALLVADANQHVGLGTLLIEHLAQDARSAGIGQFIADVLVQNSLALHVVRDTGFRTVVRYDGGTAEVTIDLTPDERAVGAIEARERSAGQASLRPLLAPAVVVVVGANERPGAVGHQILRNILAGRFTGQVYAVNHGYESVLGVPCVASADLLPVTPDLAVVAVPAARVAEVVRACGARGVRGVVVVTSGFGETGAAGRILQDEVVGIARGYGMRLVGPNCLGLLNTDPAVRLNATSAPSLLQPGGLGLISQSGALGIAVVQAASRWRPEVSQFVSVGNRADVSSNDLLLAWENDERTRVIAMYLESFGNPRKFARIARRVSRRKPIIAIKAGRSTAGQRAWLPHTAAADVAVDALFVQAGVVRVDTMEQMLSAARVLCDQPLPLGNRVAVIGNSGGPNILAADTAESVGLDVVSLEPATEQQLRALMPAAPSHRNPVDLGATATPSQIRDGVQLMLDATEVDAVLTVLTDTALADPGQVMELIVDAATVGAKPVVAVRVGGTSSSIRRGGAAHALPVFSFPEPAATALATAVKYARIRSAPSSPVSRPTGIDPSAAAEVIDRSVAAGQEWLAADDVARVLVAYGIPVCAQRVVTDVEQAALAGAELGYPLAVKIAAGARRRTEIGCVRVGVSDEVALRTAFGDVAAVDGGSTAVLVQPMAPPGIEMIIGAVQDERFGPVVMVGAGGILADVIADRAFRLGPLSIDDAHGMLGELRTGPLLDGYRGGAEVSRDALCDLVVRVGALADGLPCVAELDLDPVICRGRDLVVVDARIRVRAALPRPDPLLRQLE
jgi:acyl-CoA synthetase (NDP forming)